MYMIQGRHEDVLYEECRWIEKRTLGSDHLGTVNALYCIGRWNGAFAFWAEKFTGMYISKVVYPKVSLARNKNSFDIPSRECAMNNYLCVLNQEVENAVAQSGLSLDREEDPFIFNACFPYNNLKA